MATVEEFRAAELFLALSGIAGVLDDHAEALDSLVPGESDQPDRTSDDASPTRLGPGSDMARTLNAAIDVDRGGGDLSTLTSRMVPAARSAATGPAGRCMVAFIGALAEVSASADVIDAGRLAIALEVTAERLEESELTTEPGGLRSVVSACAIGALRAADQQLPIVEVVVAAAEEGLDELESGVVASPRLAEAGVVDAAGAAFLLVLDCLAAIVAGDALPQSPATAEPVPVAPVASGGTAPVFTVSCVAVPADSQHGDPASSTWLDTCAWLEESWHQLGILARFDIGGLTCSLELHTPDAGLALETLCSVARPTELRIALRTPGGATTRPVATGPFPAVAAPSRYTGDASHVGSPSTP